MANYATLIQQINASIKTNGANQITGQMLQTILDNMVASLGAKYQYAGVATPATNPGTPDQNVFYLAATAGTYTNFGGLVVAEGEVAALKYNGAWTKDTTGVATAAQVNQLGQQVIYDVTMNNPTAGPNNNGKFESLSALLSDANLSTLIPIAVRCGGMSIRFVQTSDNKYVQFRYMGTATTGNPNPFLDTANWQGVDDEPTAGSDNLVKSGGVAAFVDCYDVSLHQLNIYAPQDSDRYNTNKFTLSEALQAVPSNWQRRGLNITFINPDGRYVKYNNYGTSWSSNPLNWVADSKLAYVSATPSYDPSNNTDNFVYIADCAGIYVNFGNIEVYENEMAYLIKLQDDTTWRKVSSFNNAVQKDNIIKTGTPFVWNENISISGSGPESFTGRISNKMKVYVKAGEVLSFKILKSGITVNVNEYDRIFNEVRLKAQAYITAGNISHTMTYNYCRLTLVGNSSLSPLELDKIDEYISFDKGVNIQDLNKSIIEIESDAYSQSISKLPYYLQHKGFTNGVLTDITGTNPNHGYACTEEFLPVTSSSIYFSLMEGYRFVLCWYNDHNEASFIEASSWVLQSSEIQTKGKYYRVMVGLVGVQQMDKDGWEALNISTYNDVMPNGHFTKGTDVSSQGNFSISNSDTKKVDLKFYELKEGTTSIDVSCFGYALGLVFYSDKKDSEYVGQFGGYFSNDVKTITLSDYGQNIKYVRFVVTPSGFNEYSTLFEAVDNVVTLADIVNGELKPVKPSWIEPKIFTPTEPRKAAVCICVDMGGDSNVTNCNKLLPVLNTAGVKITFNVVIQSVTNSNYTRRFMERCVLLGHEVALHTSASPNFGPTGTLTDDETADYFQQFIGTFRQLDANPLGVIIQGGQGAASNVPRVSAKYFHYAQTAPNKPAGRSERYYNIITDSPYVLQRASCDQVGNFTTQEIDDAFTTAIENNALLVLYSHGYDNGDLTYDPDILDEILSQIATYSANGRIYYDVAVNAINYYHTVRKIDILT